MSSQFSEVDGTFYSAIMKSAVDPIIIINQQGVIQDVNDAALSVFKYPHDELIGEKVNLLMPTVEAHQHDNYIKQYLETKQPKVVGIGREVTGLAKDGSTLSLHLSVSEVNINGTRYFTGILKDISELTEANRLLKLKSTLLEGLTTWASQKHPTINSKIVSFLNFVAKQLGAYCATFNPNPSHAHTAQLHDAYFNNGTEQTLEHFEKISRSAIGINRKKETLLDPLTLAKLSNSTTTIRHMECIPCYSDATLLGTFRLLWINTAHVEELSRIQEVIDSCFDRFAAHLELHSTLAELKITNDRFSRSQTCANIGTWDWNIDTGELFWTERIAPLFGYSPGEFSTSYESFIAAVHPEDRDMVEAAINDCIQNNKIYDIDHRVVWPDGSIHWVNEKGDVQRDENGKPIKMLGVVQDIQRAKKAEENLIQARFEAEKASRSKSEFLSLMSHELRTPLNSVLGFAQLLELEELSSNQSLYVEQIVQGGNLLLQLVNDVLDLARIENNITNLDISEVDLHQLTQQCINLLSNQAQQADITIKHLCDGQHPMVRADYLRLKQVIINLLSNAIKYNRQGGNITVDCEVSKEHSLRLKIDDTGVGINPDKQHEVFEPFSRLDFKNSNIEGVGIGLLVTKKLVEAMNGCIDFSSEKDKGSSFWVDLPLGEQKPHLEKKVDLPKPHIKYNQTVLYIEDNPSNIKLVQTILAQQSSDTHFIKAMTGEHGLKLAAQKKPDIIILDINLPDISGIDVCAQLKTNSATKNIPVIALTADIARHKNSLIHNPNFFKVIYKPFDLNELIKAINDATSP